MLSIVSMVRMRNGVCPLQGTAEGILLIEVMLYAVFTVEVMLHAESTMSNGYLLLHPTHMQSRARTPNFVCRYLVKGTLEGYKPGQKNRTTTKRTSISKTTPYSSKYEIKRSDYSSKRIRYF